MIRRPLLTVTVPAPQPLKRPVDTISTTHQCQSMVYVRKAPRWNPCRSNQTQIDECLPRRSSQRLLLIGMCMVLAQEFQGKGGFLLLWSPRLFAR